MAEKMPIRIREHAVAGGDSYDYVKSDIVPPGELWCLQHTAYENETDARGTFRRYIEGHGYNDYLGEHQSPGAAELVVVNKDTWLIPGERLTIRQASCSASDVLSLYAHGYKIHSKFIDGVISMASIIVYRVQVHGEVTVEAETDTEAKQLALTHFAESPMNYISILERISVVQKPEGG